MKPINHLFSRLSLSATLRPFFNNNLSKIRNNYKSLIKGGVGSFAPRNIDGTFDIHMRSAIAQELIFNDGKYEPDIVGLLKVLPVRTGEAINVGANVGLLSVLLASRSEFSNVFSFEPNTSAFELLSRNISRNGLARKVHPYQIALSEATGEALLRYVQDKPEFSSLNEIVHKSVKHETQLTQKVSTETLDDFVSRNNLTPTLLVIDTEGADSCVLHGAISSLDQYRPLVLCECSATLMQSMDRNAVHLHDLLGSLEYSSFDAHSLGPFNWNPAESMLLAIPQEVAPNIISFLKTNRLR